MTQMTIIDVCSLNYPGQIELGNISFGQHDNGDIFITGWTVPDIEQPSIESLEVVIPSLQNIFDVWYFQNIGKSQLMLYLDLVAQQRQYDSAVACASYSNSTVPQWANESNTFIAWRDAVFVYTLEQIQLMAQGERTVPTFEAFKTELPSIVWPITE